MLLLPLTYDESRARFRRAAAAAGRPLAVHPIDAVGPEGQSLTIDVATVGNPAPGRALLVLSGVHGVEGFVGSAAQVEAIGRLDEAELPDDVGVVLVHAVNPWGMAWWRRQNEHNVDLNRNWRRSASEPVHNEPYDEVHHLACPDGDSMPSTDELLAAAADFVAQRGMAWVRDAITLGQYRHPDGLHYGGVRTEPSNAVLEGVVAAHLSSARRLMVFDIHTGHGPPGEITFLSDEAPGSSQDRFLNERFPGARVEATVGNPEATTGAKSGQIANGIRDLFGEGDAFSSSVEVGTVSDFDQLSATYRSHWVHRFGDPLDPEHAAAVWDYRCCFTPRDPQWERDALDQLGVRLDEAVAAVAGW